LSNGLIGWQEAELNAVYLAVYEAALFIGNYPVGQPDLPYRSTKLATRLDVIMMILGMTLFLLSDFIP
jgi:hypothetical protein